MSVLNCCSRVLFVLLVASGENVLGFSPVREALHEWMNAEELGYYFGVGSRLSVPDYQIVLLHPSPVEQEANVDADASQDAVRERDGGIDFDFTAFGRDVSLRLQPNLMLIAPDFKEIHRFEDVDKTLEIGGDVPRCHYLHQGEGTVAALSLCHDRNVHGFVMFPNDTLEIRPLSPRLHALLARERMMSAYSEEDGGSEKVPHIVRKAPLIGDEFKGDGLPLVAEYGIPDLYYRASSRAKRAGVRYTIETALFFDESGYKLFAPYFRNDDKRLRDMLLAYMNGVQALYHHSSLGESIDIVLVRLEIFKRQPSDMPHYNGERGKLLDTFCEYNVKHNPAGDADPGHWDMGLYVSGLDFFAYENGRKSGVTMGLATVGGVCQEKYACVIAELGTTNVFGKPYPSAGFTSVYILAHEMGHNLGMHHDGSQNRCPKEGYIMSPSRGTQGETLWSSCSVDVVRQLSWAKCLTDVPKSPAAELNHGKFLDEPGQAWGPKRQCEVLLRDKDAILQYPDRLEDVCQNLKCKTPHRSGFYFAGPALEGTNCGRGKWCRGGDCVVMKRAPPIKVVKGGWSDWKSEACASGCVAKARGAQMRRRTCDKPAPVNTEEGCEGAAVGAVFCDDTKVCKKVKRQSVTDFASSKCKEFSKLLPDLDPAGSGLQAPHEVTRMWMGCAIFCRRKDTGSYYTPRLDLNDLGVSPYFPDGTWCHNDGKTNHYCLEHHCLPENFSFGKSVLGSLVGNEDVPLPQNAPPRLIPLSEELLKYLSIGADGKPLLTTLKPGLTKPPADEEWDDKDYLEIPKAVIDTDNLLQEIF